MSRCPPTCVVVTMVMQLAWTGWALGVGPTYVPVDLRRAVNMDLKDSVAGDAKGGWTDQGGNDMRFLPVGKQNIRGVEFEIIDPATNGGKAAIVLFGTERPYFPVEAKVEGINKKAKSIWFLHGAAWPTDKDQAGAIYTVVYADGSRKEIPIRGGREVMNWWMPQDGEFCRVAWFGPNLMWPNVGMVMFGWPNPEPEKPIAALEFRSAKTRMIPCLVAVTLSDQDVVLPEKGFNTVATGAATEGRKTIGEVKEEDKLPPLVEGENAYRMAKKASWWQSGDVLEEWPVGGVADVSYLNDKPAGKHGRLAVKDGKLTFTDGTPGKFLATCTVYSIEFPKDQEEARRNAKWLAANGINLVRIHHWAHSGASGSIFDIYEGGSPPAGLAKTYAEPYRGNTRKFDAESWAKLDLFLAALKEEGIYVHLSVLVFPWIGRIEAEEQNIPPARFGWHAHSTEGAQMFIQEYIDQQRRFLKALFEHKNPNTGLTYAEDPMFSSVELVNEDSIFFRGNDPFRLSGYYFLELHEQFNNWLLAKYGSTEKLRAAWGAESMDEWETLIKDANFMKAGRTPPREAGFTETPPGFTTVNLDAAATTTWTDRFKTDAKDGWFDEGRENDMRFFPAGKMVLLGIPFETSAKGPVLISDTASFPPGPKDKDGKAAPDPRAANHWPKTASIPVPGGKAKSIYFLHTAGWLPKGSEPFAFYDVEYEDGSKESVGLRKSVNISDWGDPINGKECRVAWRGMCLERQQMGLVMTAWDNPHPEKEIRKIVARIEGQPALVALVGVTLSAAPAALPNPVEVPSLADWGKFVRLMGYGRFTPDGWTPGLLRRASDQITFLYELQTGYFKDQKKFIEGLGFKGLFLGSNWFCPPLMQPADNYSNAQLDLMDTHNYGGSMGLMRFPGGGTMESGVMRVFGKPFMVSEWNPARKEEYRLCTFPLISLYGQGLNGWELPMQFGCRRVGWGFYNYFWEFCINYPSDLAQYPAMALAVRRGDLKEGPVAYKRMESEEEIFARTLLKKHAYEPAWFAVGQVGTEYVQKPQDDYVARETIDQCWDKKAGVVTSATGELTWDYAKGVAICRAGRTQGAVGFVGRAGAINLPAGQMTIKTPFAAVWLTSLTDQPVGGATKILVTAVGRQDVSKVTAKGDTATYKPMIMERIEGTVRLKSPLAGKLMVYGIGYDGRAKAELLTMLEGDNLQFSFDTMSFKGPYVLITTEPQATSAPAATGGK